MRRESVEVAPDRYLSALVWGTADPELVLLHGGAQNAHTWDTMALALGRPLVAIDLPGHGHSDAGRNGPVDLAANADDVAAVVRSLAPESRAVVGMSLGGLTAIALSARAPELVRRLVLVDITPGVNEAKTKPIANFIDGPTSFDSFEEILARTVAFNPVAVSRPCGGGSSTTPCSNPTGAGCGATRAGAKPRGPAGTGRLWAAPDFAAQWDLVGALTVPLLLVRGMRPGSVVDDDDEAELRRRNPSARVEHVDAGHSVQGDVPLELAALIDDFAP